VRQYADGVQITDMTVSAIYDAYLSQRKEAPKSSDGLKAWYANTANKALVKLSTAG